MSDTPETDAFIVQNTTNEGPTGVKWRSHAERLERERDEAREDLEFRRGLYKVQEQYLETARRERDEARAERPDALSHNSWDSICRRLERERDELKKELLKCNEYNDELYRKLKQK